MRGCTTTQQSLKFRSGAEVLDCTLVLGPLYVDSGLESRKGSRVNKHRSSNGYMKQSQAENSPLHNESRRSKARPDDLARSRESTQAAVVLLSSPVAQASRASRSCVPLQHAHTIDITRAIVWLTDEGLVQTPWTSIRDIQPDPSRQSYLVQHPLAAQFHDLDDQLCQSRDARRRYSWYQYHGAVIYQTAINPRAGHIAPLCSLCFVRPSRRDNDERMAECGGLESLAPPQSWACQRRRSVVSFLSIPL